MSTTNDAEIENALGKAGRSIILVIGATGDVGREVVSQLLGTVAEVRAMALDPNSAGLPDGVGVVRGELSDRDTLESCLDGVEAVFLDWPYDRGAARVTEPEAVTLTVEEVTGTPARAFRQWVIDHADDFR